MVVRRGKKTYLRWSLFPTIFAWVVLAAIAFTLLGFLWSDPELPWQERILVNWIGDPGTKVSALELVKVSLATIGGIGAVGYLVIKYRERNSAERSEADKRLLSAVEQLGSESPQVRIAGVYALADVADTYRGNYKQRVVDILCGYLRTKRGEWETDPNLEEKNEDSETELRYISNDGPVESTILSVLALHLRKAQENPKVVQEVADDKLWCDCTIDLRNAVFAEYVPFDGVTINSKATWRGSTFVHANFKGANFNGKTSFKGVTFMKSVYFSEATFAQRVNFGGVAFPECVEFKETIFKGAVKSEGTTSGGKPIDLKEAGARFPGPPPE